MAEKTEYKKDNPIDTEDYEERGPFRVAMTVGIIFLLILLFLLFDGIRLFTG